MGCIAGAYQLLRALAGGQKRQGENLGILWQRKASTCDANGWLKTIYAKMAKVELGMERTAGTPAIHSLSNEQSAA